MDPLSGMHLTLCTWLVCSLYFGAIARAEVTCASCPLPALVKTGDIQNNARAPAIALSRAGESLVSFFSRVSLQPVRDGVHELGKEASAQKVEAEWSALGTERSALGHREPEEVFGAAGAGGALPRGKRNVEARPEEFGASARTGDSAESLDALMFVDGQKLRRNRDDAKVATSRAEEPKVISSTFALAGDSAHNHAVVYWTGQNSSPDRPAKLSDWRKRASVWEVTKNMMVTLNELQCFSVSTDYGTTYERLNDKVGVKTVLSYLYVCPTNQRKVMVLTDPEFESSILISSDEGASYQKYRLSFYVLSLLFHPSQEDWALAYSHDQKLYSSFDFGRKWHLVHERVTPNRFYWSVSGLDKEADLVHMEAYTSDGQCQYMTCRAQACYESSRTFPFPGYIEPNSLVVQDEYIVIQVTMSGRASYYVSYQRGPFVRIKIPKYSLPKDMHILSTDQGQVFAAVQEWNQNDTYNLYISDPNGVYFTLALENVKTTRGLGGNSMIDLYEVAGIKGMLIANRKVENQVKTYITYNKGRDWRLLQAPTTDLEGNEIYCVQPFCSLHLQLQMSENPYVSGSITTKNSVPGVILAIGNMGSELSYNNVGMFISSDAGNTWRQVFDEEHNVWFLDKAGALLAVKQPTVPTRHFWISFDEGRQWTHHIFSAMPLFVDGVLVEPGMENQILTFFGHFSDRSEWQLIKIDYKSLFTKRCAEGDYQTWHLHNQGEPCVMGQKQIFIKRRPGNYCMMGKETRILSAEPCICRAHDFECDYGYERRVDGNCLPAFWYNPFTISRSCSQGQNYFNSTGYRKVAANNCTKGVKDMYTARKQQCPNRPPRGLHLATHDNTLKANMGTNVTFIVQLEEGDSMRTNIQLDFGDGTAVSYSNLSWTEEGIRHVYRSTGIFRVTAIAENSLGSDSNSLYLHVTSPVEHAQLLAPFVVIKNKEVNLTAMVWPAHSRTLTYFWWLGNNTEPIITLEGSISYVFPLEGMYTVTVQVSSSNTILQDTKQIVVQEFFKSLLLSFSPNLDEANPDIPEWRQDVGRIIKKAVLQISEILANALNQNLVEFELKPGSGVIVYITQLTLAPLVDSIPRHSSSAMLMLLSVVFLGLAVFLIYKFKRKIPWINIYAEVNQEKEQEMIGTVGQNDTTPKIKLSEFSSPKELMEKDLEVRVKRGMINACESTREIPNCTSV
ncbi:VPS10 domain-containing receptor SorCS3 [Silurus meridionalis]|nr:VPS10 domain-containing receptor SorCS3 [Silurus meridionalis]